MSESSPPDGPTNPDQPDEATPPPATAPTVEPAAAPVPPPAAAPYVPVAFPQVLRTPWINPAKRNPIMLIGIVAFIVVAGAAFLIGIAVGHDGNHNGPRMEYTICGLQGQRGCPAVNRPGINPVPRLRPGLPNQRRFPQRNQSADSAPASPTPSSTSS